MNSSELKERTKRFGIAVIHFVNSLPKSRTTDIIGLQLIRSATSVGANTVLRAGVDQKLNASPN